MPKWFGPYKDHNNLQSKLLLYYVWNSVIIIILYPCAQCLHSHMRFHYIREWRVNPRGFSPTSLSLLSETRSLFPHSSYCFHDGFSTSSELCRKKGWICFPEDHHNSCGHQERGTGWCCHWPRPPEEAQDHSWSPKDNNL